MGSIGIRWVVFAAIVVAFILLPFFLFEASLSHWSAGMFQSLQAQPELGGLLIVALLAGDALLPVPSSIVSVFAGAAFGAQTAALLIWTGMSLGALLSYALGASAGRGIARVLVGRGELARARRLASDVGPAALVVTRAVPVLGEAAALIAGAARMPLWLFLLSTISANAAIAVAYAMVGEAAGSWNSFLIAFIGLVTIPAIGWAAWRLLLRRRSPAL